MYGSWSNWIESEFATLRYFAVGGTDHRSHAEQKANFAPDSPIRSWTEYPRCAAKVASRATRTR